MKLSDVRGKRTFDVIADLIAPVSGIVSDAAVKELFAVRRAPEGRTAEEYALDRIKKAVPVMLKSHQDELVEILAVLQGVQPAEYEKDMNLLVLARDVYELLTDEAFLSFLSSLLSREESGSTSESA